MIDFETFRRMYFESEDYCKALKYATSRITEEQQLYDDSIPLLIRLGAILGRAIAYGSGWELQHEQNYDIPLRTKDGEEIIVKSDGYERYALMILWEQFHLQ
jgi:hypothetical protein